MDNKNWTVEETKRLFDAIASAQKEGKGLKAVFYNISRATGRKPNSVRNFYYAHLKAMSLVPGLSKELGIQALPTRPQFVTFERDEIESLIREVLIRQAQGESVRAITTALAGGDHSLMLRYQNKYRSIIFNKKKQAEEIMRRLRAEKITYFNPYSRSVVENGQETAIDSGSVLDNLRTITNALGDEAVNALFSGLARLAYLAAAGNADDSELMRQKDREIEILKAELSSAGRSLLPKTDASAERLRNVNRHFLQKPDKDKIQSLGEYVSELGKILAAQ